MSLFEWLFTSKKAEKPTIRHKATSDLNGNSYNVSETPFVGASRNIRSLRAWMPYIGSADADLSSSKDSLVSRSRDADRNDPIAKGIIDRIVANALGTGLKLQIRIDDVALNITREEGAKIERLIEKQFSEWSKDCDYDRTDDFGFYQVLVLSSLLASGDIFINTVFSSPDGVLRLQAIEADQVCNPGMATDSEFMRGGVELSNDFVPIAYHIMVNHPGDFLSKFLWKRVPIIGEETNLKRIYHIFHRRRPQQHRGIPLLAPVLKFLRLLERYYDAELTAAVVSGYMATYIKSNFAGGISPPFADTNQDTSLTKNDREIPMSPGMIIQLEPGEDVVNVNPSRPNNNFPNFVNAIIQQIGAGVGLPADLILLVFGQSYSASRAEMVQAWKQIMFYRTLIAKKFCDPIFDLWLKTSDISEKIVPAISTFWVGPSRGAIDEEKEINAYMKALSARVITRQQVCEEMAGTDWMDVENQLAVEEALQKKHGAQTVISFTTPPIKDDNDGDTETQENNQ